MRTSYASKPLDRRNSSTLQNRTLLRLAGLRGVLRRPFGPHVAGRRLDRDRPSQRETRQFAGGQRAWRRHVIRGGRAPHLIPTDVRGDVFVERRQVAVFRSKSGFVVMNSVTKFGLTVVALM